jgi:2,4-dienoyl-CoA reductase-like NADH-dependent reductase (Old Yellow Enzyme family)
VVCDEVRERAGDVPLMTKVPAETAAPPGVRSLSAPDCVRLCVHLADYGYDAVVPVSGSVVWDASIVRGAYPERAWSDERFQDGYAEAFGGPLRARLVALANRAESLVYDFDPAWNARLCRGVREQVDVPVLAEGGIRERDQMDRMLGRDCDMVGLGRPFYAEPRLPARLLDGPQGTRVVCENCNNCAVPQVTGADGVCRTPEVLARAGRLRRAGAYDRTETGTDGSAPDSPADERGVDSPAR